MAHIYADSATKSLTKAVPTVDTNGKVIKWEIKIEYSLNDYVSTFRQIAEVDTNKEPAEFTKAELFDLANVTHLDAVYDSQYQSVKLAPVDTTKTISDFKVEDLA